MTETKKTTKAQAAKPAAKKSAAPKASAAPSGKTVTVKQTGSPARSPQWAYDTLTGLGLGKMNRTRTLPDTPAVRGMINRVHHLVTVIDAA